MRAFFRSVIRTAILLSLSQPFRSQMLISFINVLNEAGLYNLILGSRKPEAKAFKRWVSHDVLLTIHKHGMYMMVVTSVVKEEPVRKVAGRRTHFFRQSLTDICHRYRIE